MSGSSDNTTASLTAGCAEVGLPASTSQKFLDAFANSLASDVTAALVEKLAESRAEAKLAKAAEEAQKNEEEEEEQAKADEATEKQETPKRVAPEDMIQSLEKIDLVATPEAFGRVRCLILIRPLRFTTGLPEGRLMRLGIPCAASPAAAKRSPMNTANGSLYSSAPSTGRAVWRAPGCTSRARWSNRSSRRPFRPRRLTWRPTALLSAGPVTTFSGT